MRLSILYRGPLSSCNYDCHYCPFAKHHETAVELRTDRLALERFVDHLKNQSEHTFSILFTPWGEALVRRWYQNAFIELSRLSHFSKIAAQTNLSCELDWLEETDKQKIGLWCTFHPSQAQRLVFLDRCEKLKSLGISFSVGMVGLKEDFEEIERLRAELPSHIYLWVNAYKQQADYYSPTQVDWLESIDPHFRANTKYHESLGRSCQSGSTVISVDGDGTMRRCHFVKTPLGNFYDADWPQFLTTDPCPNTTCGCHIGYVHLDELKLQSVYGDGILERVPVLAEYSV